MEYCDQHPNALVPPPLQYHHPTMFIAHGHSIIAKNFMMLTNRFHCEKTACIQAENQ